MWGVWRFCIDFAAKLTKFDNNQSHTQQAATAARDEYRSISRYPTATVVASVLSTFSTTLLYFTVHYTPPAHTTMFSISRASTSAAATASHAVQHAYHAVAAGAGAGAGAAAGLGATTKTAASSVPVHWRSFSSAGHRHIPVIRSLGQLRRWRAEARDRGLEVGLVPTVSTPQHKPMLTLFRWAHCTTDTFASSDSR